MQRPIWALAAALLLAATCAPASARGLGEAGELEAARANARAGGPVSERDKELLDRYGCLSGTNSEFCRERERRHSWKRKKNRNNRR